MTPMTRSLSWEALGKQMKPKGTRLFLLPGPFLNHRTITTDPSWIPGVTTSISTR